MWDEPVYLLESIICPSEFCSWVVLSQRLKKLAAARFCGFPRTLGFIVICARIIAAVIFRIPIFSSFAPFEPFNVELGKDIVRVIGSQMFD